MGLAVAEGQCPQIVSRSWSVFGVIEQEPTVARPAGRKMPQTRLLQQHLHPFAVKSRLDLHQASQALHDQPGPDHEHERQRDFGARSRRIVAFASLDLTGFKRFLAITS